MLKPISIAKKLLVFVPLCFLAVSCSPFGATPSGAGVAKTTNGSNDWAFSNRAEVVATKTNKNPKPTDSALATSSVIALSFSPENSQKLYAATLGNGLFYSENSAETWKQVLPKFNAYGVVVDPANAEVVYVAGQADKKARVLRSDNRGKSWQEIYNDAAAGSSVRSIAISPQDSKIIIIGLASGNLIGSSDGGSTWSLLQNFQDPVTQLLWHKGGVLYIVARGKGIYQSPDGGKTVENISKQLLNLEDWRKSLQSLFAGDPTAVAQIDIPSVATTSFYHIATATNAPYPLFLAANNGLFMLKASNANWEYLKLPLKKSDNTGVRSVTLAGNDTILYAGVANTIYRSVNGGKSWQVNAIATAATINYILVDPNLPQVAYAGFIGTGQ